MHTCHRRISSCHSSHIALVSSWQRRWGSRWLAWFLISYKPYLVCFNSDLSLVRCLSSSAVQIVGVFYDYHLSYPTTSISIHEPIIGLTRFGWYCRHITIVYIFLENTTNLWSRTSSWNVQTASAHFGKMMICLLVTLRSLRCHPYSCVLHSPYSALRYLQKSTNDKNWPRTTPQGFMGRSLLGIEHFLTRVTWSLSNPHE